MSGLEVKVISEGDSSIYSRSVQSRIINAPSSPPLTSKAIQVASGRRKGFQSKNDSAVEKTTEKKVSARMPRFEDGELKDVVTKLEPMIIKSGPNSLTSSRRKDSQPISNPHVTADQSNNLEEAELNPKIKAEFGSQLVKLNISPPVPRKERSIRRPPPPEERPQPHFSPRDEVEVINSGNSSPPAARRSPPNSSHAQQSVDRPPAKPTKTKSKAKPKTKVVVEEVLPEDPTSGDNSNRRVASRTSDRPNSRQPLSNPAEVVGIRVKDINPDPMSGIRLKSSGRPQENSGPHSPPKVKGGIRVKGKKVIAKESSETSSGPPTTSGTSTTSAEVTSRRKIKSRKEAIDKKIAEKFAEDDFYPEDDEHLKFAVRAALEESKKESVKEALAAGHDLSAKVLESVTRPNAVEEVIEKMVSQRRERIQESNRRHRPKSSEKPRPFQPRRHQKPQRAPEPVPDDEDPDIETVEEERDVSPQASPPVPKSGPRVRSRISVDDGSPKAALPGSPITIATDSQNQQTSEPAPTLNSDEEANVRLPGENRPVRKGDYLEPADELGQRDFVYDPLGVDKPFGNEDDDVGDDVYEESSEDESKLTINEKKDEMLYRFKLIKEAYPGIALPRITKQMKLAKMVRHYEHVMSRVKLKIKTGNYKIFLIAAFLGMQFAAKKLGADTSGFVLNQMTAMKRYEPYLREFGESDFSAIGADLPLIIRLPFFMVVNLGIFLVAKMIFKATGKDVTEQFYKLYGQLTGGDDYVYIKDGEGNNGLGATGAEDGDGGGLFGMIKTFLGMMGGGGGGGGVSEDAPKRGEATGPTFRRRRRE